MVVSSLSFNQQGDLLLVGYSKGQIILWDVHKASMGRHIENNNGVPIVHAVFVGQDVTASRTIRAITADSRRQTLLLNFTQIPVLRRFSLNTAVSKRTFGTVVRCDVKYSIEAQNDHRCIERFSFASKEVELLKYHIG